LYDDVSLSENSPAIGKGIGISDSLQDFTGRYFAKKPSIGAYEATVISAVIDALTCKPTNIIRLVNGFIVEKSQYGTVLKFVVFSPQGTLLQKGSIEKESDFIETNPTDILYVY